MINIFNLIQTLFLRFINLVLNEWVISFGNVQISFGVLIIVFLIIVFVLDTVLNLR